MSAVLECPVLRADALFAEQLWISFASLLRSHVVMRSIARPSLKIRIASASASQIEIVSSHGTVRISASGDYANGTIELTTGEQNSFFFTADGSIEFLEPAAEPSPPMDMEAAAEHLLDQVCR